MRQRVLLVATKAGYQTRAFAEAAAREGIEIVLATDRCGRLSDPWGDGAIPIKFANPKLDPEQVDGIVAVGDQAVGAAAQIAERQRLRFHSVAAAEACCNKHLARERFFATGLLVPRYRKVAIADGARVGDVPSFPCVVKPLGLSGSRGVIRADDVAEFEAAFARVARMLGGKGEIQIEEFIPGREFAVEGLVSGGKLQVLAVFDKPDPLDGPFFEETIYVTPSRESVAVVAAIEETVARAVVALGMSDGPVHAECRMNERGVWMLEAAGRPIGGRCARVLRFGDGELGLEEVVLRHAVGRPVDGLRLTAGGHAVMMIPIEREGIFAGVEGVEEALAVEGIEAVEVTAAPGQHMLPLPEGASYLGFIFARGADAESAERAVREAHVRLRFAWKTPLAVVR